MLTQIYQMLNVLVAVLQTTLIRIVVVARKAIMGAGFLAQSVKNAVQTRTKPEFVTVPALQMLPAPA